MSSYRCNPTTRLFRPRLEALEDRELPAGLVAVGTDGGTFATVRIFLDQDQNGTYETLAPGGGAQPVVFQPYGPFAGGVRLAFGDFNGDGNDELVTAAGPGGGPHVIIWDLNPDGTVAGIRDSFMAFTTSFTGGVFVAAGDLNNDGIDELAVGMDKGSTSRVKIFSDTDRDGLVSDNLQDGFFPFTSGFPGGARVAFGNTNNTGGEELIVGAGPGGGPQVNVYTDVNGDRVVSNEPLVEAFFAYAPSFTGGVYVAGGTIDSAGNSGAEIITGKGAGGGSRVIIFSDTNSNGTVSDNAPFDQFLAYDPSFTGGVRVAAGDTDNSGFFAEVLTAAGPGGGPHVQIFDDNGDAGNLLSDNPVDDQFFAFDPSYSGGIFTAFGKVNSATYAFKDPPQTIADMATLNSTIYVPAGAGLIRDLDINLDIFHSFDGDLKVTLTHVSSGVSIILFNGVGGTNEGFLIRLDDEAGNDIGSASNPKLDGPITGTYDPQGSAVLSVFDGLDASGEWRLSITDQSPNDTGTLFGWSLVVSY